MNIVRKIRLMILALCVCQVLNSSAQIIFSIEEITKGEFDLAENSPQRYVYDFFCDSVIENNNTRLIEADVRTRFEQLDRLEKEDYDIPDFGEEYEDLFSSRSMIYAKRLDMYWFMMPTIHDCKLYCYDAQSTRYLGEMILPFAISPKGIMVAQKGYDCDWPLDLHFYKRVRNYIYELTAFKTRMYRGDAVYDYHSSKRYNVPLTSFFVGDYLLFISLYKIDKEEIVYLKITLSAPD